MGGFGSGRQDGRPLVSQCLGLDANRLNRVGCLEPGWRGTLQWERSGETIGSIRLASEAGRLHLAYGIGRVNHAHEYVEDTICIVRVACRFGGSRRYFLCPGLGDGTTCGRRVIMIYESERLFRCRRCHRLAFASQREQPYERALRRATKARLRLGGNANLLSRLPPKPKGMHGCTYERLRLEEWNAQTKVAEHLVRRLDRLSGRVASR